jgi:hypothetical protein
MCWLITFVGAFFYNFFNGSEISMKFSMLDTHIELYFKKCCAHFSTLSKIEWQTHTKQLKNTTKLLKTAEP